MTAATKRRLPSRRGLLRGLTACGGALGLAACSGGGRPAEGVVEIDYWLWDALQLPSYAAAIDRFMELNPDVSVRITQMGWDDYWSKLTASFVAESGPDVFADHLARFPEFMQLGVITPLDSLAPLEGLSADSFQDGLQQLWTGTDGKRYGIPKDYDTIAIMYDRVRLAEAGVDEAELQEWDWNPVDGGSFERILARLSVDSGGTRGDEDGFDASSVTTYGLASDPVIDYAGQTAWSPFAFSNGWAHTTEETWGTRFRFDDTSFQEAIGWYFGLVDKGFFPPYGTFSEASPASAQVQAGSSALAIAGSWQISAFANLEGIDVGIAPLPAGPVGHPVSMFNGLGDSISAQSRHKEEAARLIAFLASQEAQRMIGERAPFFPATDAGTEASVAAYADKGLDVSPFTDRVDRGETTLYPLTMKSAEIMAIMQPAFDSLWLRRISPSDFTAYNDRVNALFA